MDAACINLLNMLVTSSQMGDSVFSCLNAVVVLMFERSLLSVILKPIINFTCRVDLDSTRPNDKLIFKFLRILCCWNTPKAKDVNLWPIIASILNRLTDWVLAHGC